MKILGVIPARYESSRFPGKPLADILGKSMIQRVYEQCLQAKKLNQIIVATDDERIIAHVQSFGGIAMLTKTNHLSGTERCAEIAEKLNDTFDVCINIQGDEPFIQPSQIDNLSNVFSDKSIEIATLVKLSQPKDDVTDPNKVKVVLKKNEDALYFSRSVIPYRAKSDANNLSAPTEFFFHLGIYGYRLNVLKKLVKLQPSTLEKSESLEQLRWLENDYAIRTISTSYNPISVDTPEDLEKAINYLKENG